MKRLIKASMTKKSYYYNYGPYDPYEDYDYDDPDCIDEIKIDEKWLTEAIEYYKNAIKKYPDLSGKEIWDLLDDDIYYCIEPQNDDLYDIYINMDNTGIKITAYGYGKEWVGTGYDWDTGEYDGYDLEVDITLKVKYSIEEFMQKTPQSIIDDLYESMSYECR